MMKKIVFSGAPYRLGNPLQQLLDRTLIGYAFAGEQRRLVGWECWYGNDQAEDAQLVESRKKEWQLQTTLAPFEIMARADAAVLIALDDQSVSKASLVLKAIQALRPGSRCFVYGALAQDGATAQELLAQAQQRQVALLAGTATSRTFTLPHIELPVRDQIGRAFIVVQGDPRQSLLKGLTGLLPFIRLKSPGHLKITFAKLFKSDEVWNALKKGEIPKHLLQSAMSRSNTIQGDPERDGRTQNVIPLDLLPKLSPSAACYLLRVASGLEIFVVNLTGALRDFNVALETSSGRIISTQLYRPPPPMSEHYSLLTAHIHEFIKGRVQPEHHGYFIADALGRYEPV